MSLKNLIKPFIILVITSIILGTTSIGQIFASSNDASTEILYTPPKPSHGKGTADMGGAPSSNTK